MDLTEGTSDTLTGTLTFNLASGSSGSCALTGLYNPDRHFMVLDVAHCQGNTPITRKATSALTPSIPPTVESLASIPCTTA